MKALLAVLLGADMAAGDSPVTDLVDSLLSMLADEGQVFKRKVLFPSHQRLARCSVRHFNASVSAP